MEHVLLVVFTQPCAFGLDTKFMHLIIILIRPLVQYLVWIVSLGKKWWQAIQNSSNYTRQNPSGKSKSTQETLIQSSSSPIDATEQNLRRSTRISRPLLKDWSVSKEGMLRELNRISILFYI